MSDAKSKALRNRAMDKAVTKGRFQGQLNSLEAERDSMKYHRPHALIKR